MLLIFFPPDVDPPKLRMYTKNDGLKKIYLLSNMTLLDILNFSGGNIFDVYFLRHLGVEFQWVFH